MIIIHGLFGSNRNWASMAKRLSADFTVYSLDMRNHGRSPWAEPMDYPAMVADVQAFMDEQTLKSASFVGHSMGGKVAMLLALTDAKRVDKLIPVDIAPVDYRLRFVSYATAMRSLDISGKLSRAELEQELNKETGNSQFSQFLLQNLVRLEKGYTWRANLAVLEATMEPFIGRFPPSKLSWDGPCLFLKGELSQYIRERHHPAMFAYFPKAQITKIDNAGHWLNSEQPEQTYNAIDSFLKV